ncbi:tetratricopeptide repeat protein [Taibaiella lutea]|uniref:tetratricopeptide repeat protein n=1 Tax=Taibaiella lutea TaxID=2608001 RepID=UPI00167FE0C3|nr:tetratricopeptide repeat protein [Taibaiella lutea]
MFCNHANAQQQTQEQKQLALARQFMQGKEYEKAIPILKELYDYAPFDKDAYNEYLDALLLATRYDDAEALVLYMSKIRREDPTVLIDLGNVYALAGKKKKAAEQFDLALEKVSGDDFNTLKIADAFAHLGNNEYAIKTYKRARVLMQNQYLFGTQLALLYGKEGNTEDASNAMMDVLTTQPNELDNIKSSLLQLIDGDDKKLAIVHKQILKRISGDPSNPYWNELLTWMYIQKGDYEGAYKQITAIDKNLGESGERVLRFGDNIAAEGQYIIALKAYQYIIDKGPEQQMYELARLGKIKTLVAQLEMKKPVDPLLLKEVLREFHDCFTAYPQYFTSPLVRIYAKVQARFAGNVDTAIAALEKAIAAPNVRNDFIGYCKLDLGDYYILKDKVWDATLLYSQVDKDFKEDQLGEEARFRNAKLAYYRGDFTWAQTQLSVLKASTTELIANDALYLSVLITENTPADSNLVPLMRFAVADLLLFQNKTKESDILLDSIATHFSESALQDDILMQRSKIALEEGRNADGIAFLETIVTKYGDDVLADDAVYKLASVYEEQLKDIPKAITYYEKLITDFPGSTFIQIARVKYQKLKLNKAAS